METRAVLARFGRGRAAVEGYRRFMHAEVEPEVRDFYQAKYRKPILGSKPFIERVKERVSKRHPMEAEIPEARRVFGLRLEEIIQATARVYGKRVEALRKRRRGEANEARAMALYLCRTLGGHRLAAIGKELGLEKYSSVSSACLNMRDRVARERRLARRVRQVEALLLKSQKQI